VTLQPLTHISTLANVEQWPLLVVTNTDEKIDSDLTRLRQIEKISQKAARDLNYTDDARCDFRNA